MVQRIDKAYSVEEVFNFVNTNNGHSKEKGKVRVDFDGHQMKPYSLRYLTFMTSGTKCVCCGVEGTRFYKERSVGKNGKPVGGAYGNYHFNLYGVKKNGDEVLMTKDHILAKNLGGKDHVDNMQTMCTHCNGKKSNMTVEQWEYYLKHGTYMEGYDPNQFNQQPDPNSKKSKKKRSKKGKSFDLALALQLAKQHRKQVFYVTTLDKYCISESIEHAKKKFTKHIVVPYQEENSVEIKVNERIKLNKQKGFELPKVVDIKADSVVLQRRKVKGTLTIPMNRFRKMDKTFRGASYSYTSTVIK